jgi:HAE1 family hydrophobic/amphiphilic exporter-1
MRNFGVDVTRRGITIARNTLGINQDLFRGVLMDTAVSVEQAYLDLVYTRQLVDVVKDALFLARDQARITQIRIDVGASAPLDILQPRVQIATQEENLISAVANVRDAEDRLRALIHLDAADWDRPIIPTDRVGYTPMSIDQDAAVTKALQLRPELHEMQLTTATRRVQYVYARNQVLPRLDLNLNYNAAGLSGRSAEIDPVTGLPTGRFTSTGYSNAVSQVFGNDFPSWTVGFNVGLPVMNIGARAEAKRAELELARARTDEERIRQNIVVQVRKTVRDIDTAAKSITATRAARDAAEKNVEAERRRYENGMTTNFQVLQIQQQLSDSRAREIQALVGYNKAVAAYHRAVGDLLDVANIRVDEPELAKEPRIFSSFDRYNWLNYGNRIPTNQ